MAVSDKGNTAIQSSHKFFSFATQHVALLLSVISVLIFGIRCIAVTQGDRYTAAIHLRQTSIGDAIRAMAFSAIPSLLLMGWVVAVVMVINRVVEDRGREPATLLLVLASLATYFGLFYRNYSGVS